MTKLRIWSFAAALAATSFGCAAPANQEDAGPGLDAGCVDCGECTPETYPADCPVKACEVAVGCNAGVCRYAPFVCGQAEQACPVSTCVATNTASGLVNECREVPGAACGGGGHCVANRCVELATQLRLRGALSTAEQSNTEGGLTLHGDLSQFPAEAGRRDSDTLQLTGGIHF